MKLRVLGLACAAGLAAGCQSSAAKALSRYEATKDSADDVAQVSHAAPAGLPGSSKDSSAPSADVAFKAGEKSLQQFYRDRHDKPSHLQRARVDFEAAAKADPTSASAQHRLAIVADLQERFRDSESHYRTAMSLDPKNPNIAADLGWSYILQERWADAERALQRALELDPNSSMARDHLAKCQQQAGPQTAATSRGISGQMLANQPASVGQDRSMGPPPRDIRPGQQPAWGPQAIPPEQMGEYMRHQMSQVDHYGASPAGQPMTIGPRSPNVAAANGQLGQPVGPPLAQTQYAPPQYGPGPNVQPQQNVNAQPAGQTYWPNSETAQRQQFFTHIEPQRTPQRPAVANQPPPPQYPQANTASHAPQARPQANEWTNNTGNYNAIQRTQAIEAPARPDHAMYQAPQLPSLPGQALAGPPATQTPMNAYPQRTSAHDARSTAPPAGFGQPQNPQQPANPRQSANSLEQARRDAALMGLGLGPGQLFPSLEQPADRVSPGSMSQMNGAAFPAPPIYSPDLTPPPDLRQNPSFFEQPGMTPPTNSMGQTLPGGTSSMMTPGSINDPHARLQRDVNPASAQMPQLPPSPNVWNQSHIPAGLQGYDGSRRAADQQLQQTLQSTWANTPSNAIPSPASGISMPQPAAPSQMMHESWGRQPVAPEPYPHAAQQQTIRSFQPTTLPAVNPSPGRMPANSNPYPPAGRFAQPAYRDGVVVPEQYGPGRP